MIGEAPSEYFKRKEQERRMLEWQVSERNRREQAAMNSNRANL